MERIDQLWLSARGNLHDATLTAVQLCGADVEIGINDEWTNERGLTLPVGDCAPGTIILVSAILTEGLPHQAVGGWISNIQFLADHFLIQFCDRDPLAFKVAAAEWRIDTQTP